MDFLTAWKVEAIVPESPKHKGVLSVDDGVRKGQFPAPVIRHCLLLEAVVLDNLINLLDLPLSEGVEQFHDVDHRPRPVRRSFDLLLLLGMGRRHIDDHLLDGHVG